MSQTEGKGQLIRFLLIETLRKLYVLPEFSQILLIGLFYCRLYTFSALFCPLLNLWYQKCLYYAILCPEIVLIYNTYRMNENVLFSRLILFPHYSFLFRWKVEPFLIWSHRTLTIITFRLWRWNLNAFGSNLRRKHLNDSWIYVINCDFNKFIIQWNKYSNYFYLKSFLFRKRLPSRIATRLESPFEALSTDKSRWK